MFIGSLELLIKLYDPRSLKEKRSIVKSLIRRLGNKYNISVAEVNNQEDLNLLALGIAVVSGSKVQNERLLWQVINFIDNDGNLEILSQDINIY